MRTGRPTWSACSATCADVTATTADLRRLLHCIAGARRLVVTATRVTKQVRDKRAEGKRSKRVSTDAYVLTLFPGGRLDGLSGDEARTVQAALQGALQTALAPVRHQILAHVARVLDASMDLHATKLAEMSLARAESLEQFTFQVQTLGELFSVGASGNEVTLVGTDDEAEALVDTINARLREIVEPYIARLEEQARTAARALREAT